MKDGRKCNGEPCIDPSVAMTEDPDSEWMNEMQEEYGEENESNDKPREDMVKVSIEKLSFNEVSTLDLSPRIDLMPIETLRIDKEIIGRLSAESICPYPPGIPILLRGKLLLLVHSSRLIRKHSSLYRGKNSLCSYIGAYDSRKDTWERQNIAYETR